MQLGLWSEKERGKKKGLPSEASRARDWGREGAAEPGDMPFMLPIHDTRSWYHDLIGQSAQC